MIYFYNAGTLTPSSGVTPVVKRMKELFKIDFGVEPFVVLDIAFPALDVADAVFAWNTFDTSMPNNLYNSPTSSNGKSFANFMPRWDATGRDSPGQLLKPDDRVAKGPEILEKNLQATANTDYTVIATWNDLGEGTGINRNYDYWYKGKWLPPNHFMKVIRQSQCEI